MVCFSLRYTILPCNGFRQIFPLCPILVDGIRIYSQIIWMAKIRIIQFNWILILDDLSIQFLLILENGFLMSFSIPLFGWNFTHLNYFISFHYGAYWRKRNLQSSQTWREFYWSLNENYLRYRMPLVYGLVPWRTLILTWTSFVP